MWRWRIFLSRQQTKIVTTHNLAGNSNTEQITDDSIRDFITISALLRTTILTDNQQKSP